MSFDVSGNLVMEEMISGSVQANSETAYFAHGTITGQFSSYQFSIEVDKIFKPSEISTRRKGAVLSRTNITNIGELGITELSFEDKILDGWALKDFDKTISVTLFIDGEKYKIPYEELAFVAVENGVYKVQIDFSSGIDLYQFDPKLGYEVYIKTIYVFQPGWILEIKYPIFPPINLEEGEYTSTVSIMAISMEGISIIVNDIGTLVIQAKNCFMKRANITFYKS